MDDKAQPIPEEQLKRFVRAFINLAAEFESLADRANVLQRRRSSAGLEDEIFTQEILNSSGAGHTTPDTMKAAVSALVDIVQFAQEPLVLPDGTEIPIARLAAISAVVNTF
jgi:hypothetical protein